MTNASLCSIMYLSVRDTEQHLKEITIMTFTYKTYLLNRDIEKYKNDIQILEVVNKMDLGAILHFTCSNQQVLDEIFADDIDL